MTPARARALTYLIWAIGFIPAALVAMWFGMVDWSWRGFAVAYVIVGAIGISYEFFMRWIARWLQRRRDRRRTASISEH